MRELRSPWLLFWILPWVYQSVGIVWKNDKSQFNYSIERK
jgi:hypothetical protein